MWRCWCQRLSGVWPQQACCCVSGPVWGGSGLELGARRRWAWAEGASQASATELPSPCESETKAICPWRSAFSGAEVQGCDRHLRWAGETLSRPSFLGEELPITSLWTSPGASLRWLISSAAKTTVAVTLSSDEFCRNAVSEQAAGDCLQFSENGSGNS